MSTTQPPKPKRRWYQFSLKTLLIVMTVAIVAFGGWVQYRRQRAQENRDRVAATKEVVKKTVSAIRELGGVAYSEHKVRRPQTWSEKLFDDPGCPDDPVSSLKVSTVYLIYFRHSKSPKLADGVYDDKLKYLKVLKGITDLRELDLSNTNVTDAGLEHLRGLENLEELRLARTNVTGAGFEHVKRLPKLQLLDLWDTNVSDAGLERLRELTNLQLLDLRGTKVTDEGVKKLQQALPKCKIYH